MKTQTDLQLLLEELFGSRNVYFQPPDKNFKMEYPAIKYSVAKRDNSTRANNSVYLIKTRYEITVIDKLPDNEVITKLLGIPYCTHDRSYKADNLNHDVFTLYF